MTKSTSGLTLIELLIVIAIIGILAAVLLPNMMNARELARNRSTEIYAKNVFTASFGYVAEDVNKTVITGDCTTGFVSGNYSIDAPGPIIVANCRVTDADGDNIPEVFVRSPNGYTVNYPN